MKSVFYLTKATQKMFTQNIFQTNTALLQSTDFSGDFLLRVLFFA